MSRKQGIIRLGRSKSPGRNTQSMHLHQRVQSYVTSRNNSREKQPFGEVSNMNQSMHVPPTSDLNKSEHVAIVHTQPSGFYPPSPKNLHRVVVKQNVRSPDRQFVRLSPSGMGPKVVVTRPLVEASPSKVTQQVVQITQVSNVHLERKIKVLETRVQELHQEKQACVLRAHEENKRLCLENMGLQRRLVDLQNGKNQQIFGLRAELEQLRQGSLMKTSIVQRVQSKPDLRSELQNQINQLLTKIGHLEAQNHQLGLLPDRVRQLEQENNKLAEDLEQMKQTIVKTSAIIEENNQNIIANYEIKVTCLTQELQSERRQAQRLIAEAEQAKAEAEQAKVQVADRVSELAELSLQLNQKVQQCEQAKVNQSSAAAQVEQYVEMLCKKSQELNRVEKLCQQAQENLAFSQQQTEEYVDKLLKKSQEFNSLESRLEEQLHLSQQQEQKIHELETSLRQKSYVEQNSTTSQASCLKCKQLIKALVKLNQKPFTKTI